MVKGTILGIWIALACFCEGQTIQIFGNQTVSGQTFYAGNNSSAAPCIHVNTGSALTLHASTFYTAAAVYGDPGSWVNITGCYFHYQGTNPATDCLVHTWESAAVYIVHNEFDGTRAVEIYGGSLPQPVPVTIDENVFLNCWNGAGLNGVNCASGSSISYNQFDSDDYTPVNDQINCYYSSGVDIMYDLIQRSPVPYVAYASAIVSADLGTTNTLTEHCICLNGGGGAFGLIYANSGSQIDHCEAYGIGGRSQWSAGIQYCRYNNAGKIFDCVSSWHDPYYGKESNYAYAHPDGIMTVEGPMAGGNGNGAKITLAGEKSRYWNWRAAINAKGRYLGPDGYPPEIHYPSDLR